MNDLDDKVPHFLRVVRAIASVKGPLPVLAAITTVVAGVHCSHTLASPMGFAGCTDSDCVQGDVCYEDMCVALTSTPCTTDAQCDGSETCDTAEQKCVRVAGTGGTGGAGGSGIGGGTHGTGGAGGSGGAKGSGGAGGGG